MTEHFPNPNHPEDREDLPQENFGPKEGGTEKTRRNSKKNSEKENDKKPQPETKTEEEGYFPLRRARLEAAAKEAEKNSAETQAIKNYNQTEKPKTEPEISPQKTQEEIKEFQDFILVLEENIKSNLDSVDKFIKLEEKNPRGMTLEHLKEIRSALSNLLIELSKHTQTPLKPENLDETRKNLSDLTAKTNNYIKEISQKISAENK